MRGLAEFVMRGRWQALAVAVLGSGSLLFGWISAAAVALVTLRKGAAEGGWLVLWALLPAVVLAWISGDAGGVLLLAGVFGMAVLLRETVSLPLTIVATIPVGLVSGAFLLTVTGAFLEQLVTWFGEFLSQLEGNLNAGGSDAGVQLVAPTVNQVAGLLAAGNAALCTVGLLLGRYWQSALYHPGGFGSEFRSLRLPLSWTLGLAAITAALWVAGPDWSGWALIFAVPLTFCGFSLAHARARSRGQGVGWLAAFYLLWLVFDPVKALLLGFVIADAFIDFRRQWPTESNTEN
jgi:hypothetical protein